MVVFHVSTFILQLQMLWGGFDYHTMQDCQCLLFVAMGIITCYNQDVRIVSSGSIL